jgi:acetyl-CoA synthetase
VLEAVFYFLSKGLTVMQNNNSTTQLMDVAMRIREMREILGYSIEKMAELTQISVETYQLYESGSTDLPFTFMHNCAKAFGVEIPVLLEGHSAKLSGYTVTRRGKGLVTASEDGITIQNMAPMFRKKLATPYWVTYQYSEELQNQPIHTTTHAGQEFDLVIRGAMRIRVGDHEEVLHEGDSIFYKSSTPHGMIAIDGEDCVFLSMIMADDKRDTALQLTPATPRKAADEPLLCNRFVWGEEDENGALTNIRFADEEQYNFAFDTVDAIARQQPEKLAMVHIANDMTERHFTFKDMKDASSQCANYFKSLGIKRGDRVMLVLKRHYQFWFAILGLHKLGAVAIPATNQLVEKDFTYRFQAGGVSAILCTADGDTAKQVELDTIYFLKGKEG